MGSTPLNFLTFANGRVRTILGWTPGLRALVGGAQLPCGCLIGSYETWAGDLIDVVDSPGHCCAVSQHTRNAVVRADPPEHSGSPVDNLAPHR